jgi:predicted RNase H-like HicB family nuclease
MAHDAICAYIESLRKDGEAIPADTVLTEAPVKETVRVVVPA